MCERVSDAVIYLLSRCAGVVNVYTLKYLCNVLSSQKLQCVIDVMLSGSARDAMPTKV